MKKWIYFSLTAALAASMAACGDDDGDGPDAGGSNGGDGSVGKNEILDPVESKLYLQDAAEDFMGKFKPADQADFINTLKYFSEYLSELDFPDDFSTDAANPASAMMKTLLKAYTSGNYAGLSRATSSYTLAFKDYQGIYEARGNRWVKTSNSNDIIFRWSENGTAVEAKAEASDGSYDVDFSVNDWDEWYDENGYWQEEQVTYNYNITVPKTIKVSLTRGGSNIFTSTTKTDYSSKNHTLTANTDTKIANLQVIAKINGKDSEVSDDTEVYVDGQCIVKATAKIKGSNLCNFDALQNLDEDNLDRYFKTGSAETDLMGKVQVKASGKSISDIIEAMDYEEDAYENSAAKSGAEKMAKQMANCVDAKIYFGGTSTVQATLDWHACIFGSYTSPWGNYEWWGIEPVLKFSDGTTYSFDEYFGGNRFSAAVDNFENLIDRYINYWNK